MTKMNIISYHLELNINDYANITLTYYGNENIIIRKNDEDGEKTIVVSRHILESFLRLIK